jgi:hypothetical protein
MVMSEAEQTALPESGNSLPQHLGLIIATLDPVAWLIGHESRQKVGLAVDAVERLGGPVNQGSTFFREDANLHPNKLTDLEAIVRHAERTYWVVPSSCLVLDTRFARQPQNKEPRSAEHRTGFCLRSLIRNAASRFWHEQG